MKKMFALFVALFLVGCSASTSVDTTTDAPFEGMTAEDGEAPKDNDENEVTMSWEAAAELFADCEVTQTAELHNGELRITKTDGSEIVVESYESTDLQAATTAANAACDTQIVIAIE